jgi:glycosyltransferase involved in cell wall biosynthesis
MKILHAISGIRRSQGGPTFALEGLARAQKAIGLDVSVVATYIVDEGRDAARHFAEMGVECSVYGPAHGKFSRLAGLNEIIAQHVAEADVVHIHAMWEEIQHVTAVESRRAGKPYVWRACNAISWPIMQKSYWFKRAVLAWRLKKDLNGAAAMHYTTQTEADESKWLGLSSPSIVEPNGVDLSEDSGSAERFLDRYPQLQGRRVLLFVGRLNPEKGFEILIPAFAQAELDDAMLVIVGSDPDRPYRATIELMMQEHALSEDRVLFTGHLDGVEKQDAYAAADCLVLSSKSENFGNVVVEALGQGLPVIVTRGVGLSSELALAGVGAVVDYDIDSLRAAIEKAFTSPGGLQRSDIARRFVAERFDWAAIARRWEGHYRRIVSERVIGS